MGFEKEKYKICEMFRKMSLYHSSMTRAPHTAYQVVNKWEESYPSPREYTWYDIFATANPKGSCE